jgi:hypothetical protein
MSNGDPTVDTASGLFSISVIAPDPNSNSYVRLIQIYADLPDVTNRRPIVELLLYGGDQTAGNVTPLQINVPGGIVY